MCTAIRRINHLGLPIGPPLPEGWNGAAPPPRTVMRGLRVWLEPLDAERHGTALFNTWAADREGRIFIYMPFGPFDDASAVRAWAASVQHESDPQFFAAVPSGGGPALGVASYLRIKPGPGTIEVGWICYGPQLQRTPEATEVMYLMMRRAFDELGYRRYEWKCDALNAVSRRAAARLGFTYEGTFRQATHYKGRNRDTAWFAILDSEWPAIRDAQERWLDPENFDSSGQQKASLSALTADALRNVAREGAVSG